MMAAVGLVAGSPPQMSAAGAVKPAASDNLLLRVQFAGTTALTANTNSAYLTNFAALPETARLGTQIVARMASLPVRLVNVGTNRVTSPHPALSPPQGAERVNGAHGVTRPTREEQLQPVFTDMLRDGFTLELRGDSKGVTDMALAAKSSAETAPRWNAALAGAAKHWFGSEPTKAKAGEAWTAGGGAMQVQNKGDWTWFALGRSNAAAAFTALQQTTAATRLDAGNVLQVELASSLIPGPIQRSVYGGFSRLQLSVTPADQSLKIRGTASYAADLPRLTGTPVVPTNLVTEPAISFTMVREPGAWLAPDSALRRFLPKPVPETAFFWGGESSPYQFFMAMPFTGRGDFSTNFGLTLISNLAPLAQISDSGPVVLDTNRHGIQWQGVPFVAPNVLQKKAGPNDFLVAEVFPASDFPPGLTPALIGRVSGRTNLVLFDWEFTQLRCDTWFRIGQLALFVSGHQQLGSETPSLKWIQAAQARLADGGNTFTEITQTGPRELSLTRRAPLAFTSVEIFWLANWLESERFPGANFAVPLPAPPPATGTTTNRSEPQ